MKQGYAIKIVKENTKDLFFLRQDYFLLLLVIKVWWFNQQSFCGDLKMFEADGLSVFNGIYIFIQLT